MFIKINKGKQGAYPKVTFINTDHIAKFEAAYGSGLLAVHFFSQADVQIGFLKIYNGDEANMQLLRSILGDETTTQILHSLSDDTTDA
jgi:hypothetical protein